MSALATLPMDDLLTRYHALDEQMAQAGNDRDFFEAIGDEDQAREASELWASLNEEQEIVSRAILRAGMAASKP